ncbi:MAG: hypothetical protein NTV34_13120 [Proteobacteria bacterium]|nr:hypothetical protein [Pseudomonadota bacterium]
MSQNNSNVSPILEILKQRGILSSMSSKSVRGFMERWQVDAYRAVVETHCAGEVTLADVLAAEFRLTRIVRLRSRPPDMEALKHLSYRDAMELNVLPYSFDGDGRLQVALSDPTPRASVEAWVKKCSFPIDFYVGERSEIEAAIQRNYPLAMQLPMTMASCIQDVSG